MVTPSPFHPPRLVGEAPELIRLPDDLIEALSYRFQSRIKEGGYLNAKRRTGQGFHSFLSHLASDIDPIPGSEQICLLVVDQDGTVNLTHLLFYVPVGI